MPALAGLTELVALTLNNTPISQVGSESLKRLPKLVSLSLTNTDASRELYVVQDHGNQLTIRLGRAGVDKVLTRMDVPASIAKDAPRTLEFRVVGDTLTATLNGSVIATATDATIPTGNFALVALKGVLIQKVEHLTLDER